MIDCIINFKLLVIEELDHVYFCQNNKVKAAEELFRLCGAVEEGLGIRGF